jgi:hypothetical protein
VARQTGTAAGGPLNRLTLELGGKPESVGRRIRTCALVNPVLKIRNGGQPPAKAGSHQNIHYGAPSWP